MKQKNKKTKNIINDDLDEAKRRRQVFRVQAYTETSSSTFFLFFSEKYGENEGYQQLLHLFSLHPIRKDANWLRSKSYLIKIHYLVR